MRLRLPTVFIVACILFGLAAGPPGLAETTRGPASLNTPGTTSGPLYEGSYALLIGVSQYEHWPSLDSIPQELDEIEALLKQQGFTVKRVDDPDDRELQAAFRDFINQYGRLPSRNRLLFYFAGHGYTLDGEGYLVPRNAPDWKQDRPGFVSAAYSMIDIKAWAQKIKAVHALFLFDSCFSGTIFQTREQLPEIPLNISEDALEPVRKFISAGKANQTVPARSDFAAEFVKALRFRKADKNNDGYVTGLELGTYLNGEVRKYNKQTPQYGKIDDPRLNVGDFIFTVGQAAPLPPVAAPTPVTPEPQRGTPPPLPTAKLTVRSNVSGDTVYIDGEEHGATPVSVEVEQRPHLVRVEKAGYKPFEQWLEISGPFTMRARLEPGAAVTPGPPKDDTAASGVIPSQHKQVFRDPLKDGGEGPEMVQIPAGEFTIGSPDEANWDSDEGPRRRISVAGFAIGKYEVSFDEYDRFCEATGRDKPGDSGWGRGKRPVINVSWHDAAAYAQWLSAQTGKSYRLPSEAEWEYAVRGICQ
jgi:hypothetical protein